MPGLRTFLCKFGVLRATAWGLFLGAAAASLAADPAQAAGKFDASAPFICVPATVAECGTDGNCERGSAESNNLPRYFEINLQSKSVRSEEKGTQSTIERVTRAGDEIVLRGAESGRAWVMIVDQKTGNMSGSVTGDGEAFVIFGVCLTP